MSAEQMARQAVRARDMARNNAKTQRSVRPVFPVAR